MSEQNKQRRIRMCHCPSCEEKTPLNPKGRGDDIYLTACANCFIVFENEKVESWLEDRELPK